MLFSNMIFASLTFWLFALPIFATFFGLMSRIVVDKSEALFHGWMCFVTTTAFSCLMVSTQFVHGASHRAWGILAVLTIAALGAVIAVRLGTKLRNNGRTVSASAGSVRIIERR